LLNASKCPRINPEKIFSVAGEDPRPNITIPIFFFYHERKRQLYTKHISSGMVIAIDLETEIASAVVGIPLLAEYRSAGLGPHVAFL
jgi:hypothetical protein